MYTLGMIPSPPDERDYTLDKAIVYSAAPIEDIMIPYIPKPLDQGPFGMCVAVALAGILEAAEYKQRGVEIAISPKYIYGNRSPRDYKGEGMRPREALQTVTRFGAPRRELLPGLSNYETAKASITPALDGEGLPNRLRGYVRLKTMQDVSDYFRLYGLPILFGLLVTPSFMNVPSGGMVPAPSGDVVGGHAVRGIGIRNGRLVIQNSWGSNWGDNWIGYIDISEHKGLEMWGPIPEGSETLIDRPQEMLLTLGRTTMVIDNRIVEMDVAPFIKDNRTFVPLRFVIEAMGGKVTWYPDAQMIHIKWGGEEKL